MKGLLLTVQLLIAAGVSCALLAHGSPEGHASGPRPGSRHPRTPPPPSVMPAGSDSLAVRGDLELGGSVFREGRPLLHTHGGRQAGNTALGLDALLSSTPGVPEAGSGKDNSAVGVSALRANTTGFSNSALGRGALAHNLSGYENTAVGADSLRANTIGLYNTAIGASALWANEMGSSNTAVGAFALYTNQYSGNTAVGVRSLAANHDGASNTAVGYGAMFLNRSGDGNTAVGERALRHCAAGGGNVAIGAATLWSNVDGSNNVAIGRLAGRNATGDDNIYIRNEGHAAESGTIRIGTAGTHFATFIAGIASRSVDPTTAVPVRVDATGKLGTLPSSRRYKEQIRGMGDASRAVMELRPVTFRFTETVASGLRGRQFGLVAEEVARVFPELVTVDSEGRPDSVRYDLLVPLLLNEVQRLHDRLQGLEARLAGDGSRSAEVAVQTRRP